MNEEQKISIPDINQMPPTIPIPRTVEETTPVKLSPETIKEIKKEVDSWYKDLDDREFKIIWEAVDGSKHDTRQAAEKASILYYEAKNKGEFQDEQARIDSEVMHTEQIVNNEYVESDKNIKADIDSTDHLIGGRRK